MKEVYELDVYRLAEELSDLVWFAFDKWDGKAQHTLGLQVIRAVDSISANIAEGYGRYTPADRKKFFLYARGSFEETKCWLRKACRRNIISAAEVASYKKLVDELGPKLNAFISATRVDRCPVSST
jgi:four helix bundle protein